MKCPNCGSDDILKDDGTSYCGVCGCVVHESTVVVDEPIFAKDSDGTSQVVGQFVPASGAGPMCSESRQNTIDAGRRRIAQLAGYLRISPALVEAAQRNFHLAVQNDFVRGRKTQNVAAACLYIVCRREKTSRL